MKTILILCLTLFNSLNAQGVRAEESTANRIATISLSSLVSLAGGIGGGLVGFGLGIGVEEVAGSTCSGSDFCIGAAPIIGFSVGYPIGASSAWDTFFPPSCCPFKGGIGRLFP